MGGWVEPEDRRGWDSEEDWVYNWHTFAPSNPLSHSMLAGSWLDRYEPKKGIWWRTSLYGAFHLPGGRYRPATGRWYHPRRATPNHWRGWLTRRHRRRQQLRRQRASLRNFKPADPRALPTPHNFGAQLRGLGRMQRSLKRLLRQRQPRRLHRRGECLLNLPLREDYLGRRSPPTVEGSPRYPEKLPEGWWGGQPGKAVLRGPGRHRRRNRRQGFAGWVTELRSKASPYRLNRQRGESLPSPLHPSEGLRRCRRRRYWQRRL